MVTLSEIKEVIAWCEKVKKDKKVVSTVERNPFEGKIRWMGVFPLIEIDRPTEIASKRNLVYDSTTGVLLRYMSDTWMEIVPDVQENVRKRDKEK